MQLQLPTSVQSLTQQQASHAQQVYQGLICGCAYRLRQNLQVPADGRPVDAPGGVSPENAAGKAQQYLRLPVESAKKLRWYDRPDLNNLVQLNLRDKNDLLGVNAALRQVVCCESMHFRQSSLPVHCSVRSILKHAAVKQKDVAHAIGSSCSTPHHYLLLACADQSCCTRRTYASL